MIEIRDLVKRFDATARPAIDHLTLTIPAGEVCVLIGPSGCGKTTTMRVINRMIDPAQNPSQNVSLIIIGDFARSLPGSDHQPNLSVAVFGKNVARGTTGKVAANVSLPSGTPGVTGMWSYLAAASKVATNPFGANPHGLVL